MVGKRTGWIFVLFLFIGLTVFTSLASAADFDTLLVLGSGDRSGIINRVDGIGEVIYANNFGKIVLSGGCVSLTKKPWWTEQQYQTNLAARTCPDCNTGCTEAEEMQKLLLEKDPSLAFKIELEDKSKSTIANYQNSVSLLGNKVVVLSNHPHAKAVSYCLKYSDKKDAYYYVIGETTQPTIIPQDTTYDYGGLVASCKGVAGPSQPLINNPSLQTNPSQGQQYATSLVPKNLPQQQREIDESWSVKIGNTIRNSILIWDDTLGPWDWRNYTDVYFTVVSTPVSKGVVMGQGSAAGGSYSAIEYSKGGDAFNSLITEAGQNLGIEKEFIKAIMKAESGFKITSVSASNYVGLMQIRASSDNDQYITVQCDQRPANTGIKLCDINQLKVNHLYPVCTSTGSNCQEDDRFDPKKNIYSGTQHLIDKITSLGFNKNSLNECQMKATIAAYNLGQTHIRKAVTAVGCNAWETVWNELNANTIISPDGTCTIYDSGSNSYPHNGKPDCRHKLDNLKNTDSYLSKIYGAYLGYMTYGLGSSNTGAEVSSSSSLPDLPVQTVAGNIKAMTFNLHGGKEGINNVIQLIKQYQPDIIGFQEVSVNYYGGDDFAKLKQESGLPYGEFFAAINQPEKQFGNAILSKTTLTGVKGVPYVNQVGNYETRNYQKVKTSIKGKEITFFNTHIHNVGKELQEKQMQELASAASKETSNVIITGDFNHVGAAAFFPGFANDQVIGMTHVTKKQKIDFIFFSSGLSVASSKKITTPVASDHYPIIVGLN